MKLLLLIYILCGVLLLFWADYNISLMYGSLYDFFLTDLEKCCDSKEEMESVKENPNKHLFMVCIVIVLLWPLWISRLHK